MPDQKLNILLCDDSEDDRFFFRLALKEIDHALLVDTVSDGDELMNWLEKKKDNLPDVLFLDLNMPRKNGYKCLEEIKKEKAYQTIAVVIYSTTDDPETISKIFNDNAQLYIVKPSEFKRLPVIILKTLSMLKENAFNKLPMEKFVVS